MTDFFPGLRDTEHIVFWIRKHWMAYFNVIWKLAVQLTIAAILASQIISKLDPNTIIFYIFAIMLVFYLLTAWLWMFLRFMDEDFDTLIVTNERIISTTQSKFVTISTSSANLDEVQDAKSSVAGFLGGLFHYGILDIQTAGKNSVFEINYVEEPEHYIDGIIEMKETYLKNGHGG